MGGKSSCEEEEVDIIDAMRIIWDELGNLKIVKQEVAEEKHSENSRRAELEAIIKAEWEDQQEQDKLNEIKAREKEEQAVKFKEHIERLRAEQREKIANAIANREALPAPLVEPKIEEEVEETTWYVMSSPWIEAWLEYVNVQKGINSRYVRIVEAPYPGPCDNSVLLKWALREDENINDNEVRYCWQAKKNLILASTTDIGDYRRVSKRVWETYKKLYPKSGPEIKMKYVNTGKFENAKMVYVGSTSLKNWQIINPPPPPAGAKLKKIKKVPKSKVPINTIDDSVIDKREMAKKLGGTTPGTAKSPITELARLKSDGPDSDDDSIDEIILSTGKTNNKLSPSSSNVKIAFQTVGKDSDDDDDDDDPILNPKPLSPPKSIIPNISGANSNSKVKLPGILLKNKDSDDDSDEGFEMTKNKEALKLAQLSQNQKKNNDTSSSKPTNNKNVFSINNYTRDVAEPDSDDDDTVTDEKGKEFKGLNITPNQTKFAMPAPVKSVTPTLSINLNETPAPTTNRIDDDSPEKRSIMSLLTSKNN